jgi:hypothetical protein
MYTIQMGVYMYVIFNTVCAVIKKLSFSINYLKLTLSFKYGKVKCTILSKKKNLPSYTMRQN